MPNWRAAASAFLLALLVAFWGWSLDWAVSARTEMTLGFPGAVSSLDVRPNDDPSTAIDADGSLRRLVAFLDDHTLAVAVASQGDGPPAIWVLDPDSVIPWLAADGQHLTLSARSIALFAGSYSAEVWARGRTVPFAPSGADVQAVIPPPPGAYSLQYVGALTAPAVVPGTLVVNTWNRQFLDELAPLLAGVGLQVSEPRVLPLSDYLKNDPMLRLTSVFLLAGVVASAAHLVLYFASREQVWRVRMQCGATVPRIVGRESATNLATVACFTLLGCASSALLVRAFSGTRIEPSEILALGVGALAAGALSLALWSAVLAVTLNVRKSRYVA